MAFSNLCVCVCVCAVGFQTNFLSVEEDTLGILTLSATGPLPLSSVVEVAVGFFDNTATGVCV